MQRNEQDQWRESFTENQRCQMFIDEENPWDDSAGVIEKKLRQQITIKKESHELRLGG